MNTEILKLKEEIKRHNYLYYELAQPEISDQEFDLLLEKLNRLETEFGVAEDSPSNLVGGFVNSKFEKVKHETPMLSLANSYDLADIKKWEAQIKKEFPDWNEEVLLESKLDGLSCSLIYEGGLLMKAVTRGDGITGEDITDNVTACFNVPLFLQEEIDTEIRGELVISKKDFAIVNKNNEYKNARNLCSGSIRQKDSSLIKSRRITFCPYYVMSVKNNTLLADLKKIKKLGFQLFTESELLNINDLFDRIKQREASSDKTVIDIDGLVLKVNDKLIHETIGYTSKFPKWAIAYKFTTEKKDTLLKAVTYQVGKTGIITPVAELEEIELAGTKVKRASLHNFDEIKRKDIRLNDYVIVEKAAEIIPYVCSSVVEKRTGLEQEIIEPSNCPVCNATTKRDGVYLKCTNPKCKAQVLQKISYFASKEAMEIKGLSEKTISKLMDNSLLQTEFDLYKLKLNEAKLKLIPGFGDQSVDNLLTSIATSLTKTADKVLIALQIPQLGTSMSKRVLTKFKTIEALSKASKEELMEVEGIAELTAEEIFDWFSKNKTIVDKLKLIGLETELELVEVEDNEFKDKKICITGSFELERSKIKTLIESKGASVTNSISKKTDFLLCGDAPGSKKEKAEALKIKIINLGDLECKKS